MKAIVSTGIWPRTALVVAERKPPAPRADELLVQVHAASVNPKDWKLNGSLALCLSPLGNKRAPAIFGDDLAGTVVEAGTDAGDFKPGDRVYGMDMRPRTVSLAELAVINVHRVARMPKNLSFAEAASMPLAAQTALQGLRQGGARAGSAVLIIGASGGVGTFAVQIARIMGCQVSGVCSTANLDLVRELGADEAIDYTAGDYRKAGPAYDLVFDVTAYETPRSCAGLLKSGARFVSTGGNLQSLVATNLTGGRNASSVFVESHREDLDSLTQWVEAGELRPVIDSRYALADTEAAYRRSRTGRARGKIVIEVA